MKKSPPCNFDGPFVWEDIFGFIGIVITIIGLFVLFNL